MNRISFRIRSTSTINDNVMLSYSVTTMVCILTKHWCGFLAYTVNLFMKVGKTITKGNRNNSLIPIQSERTMFVSVIAKTDLCYSLAKHARFCEPGTVTLSQRHFQFFVHKLVEDNWGNTGGVLVSSRCEHGAVQSLLKSFFNYLNSIYSYC